MTNPSIDTDYQIATYADGVGALVTLKSLGISNPHPLWYPAVSKVKLGNNSARLLGAPYVEWRWGYMQSGERDILRTYCKNASALVYIWTPTTEKVSGVSNAAARYQAQMIWPAPEMPEDPQTGRRVQFSIIFRQLVSV